MIQVFNLFLFDKELDRYVVVVAFSAHEEASGAAAAAMKQKTNTNNSLSLHSRLLYILYVEAF